MNKEELIENLGTIAHSGSQDFSNKIQNSDSPSSSSDIIGQVRIIQIFI
jgi:HSP90 family molecular chaperone